MARPFDPADLPADIARAAQAQVAAGRFASVEDVLRAGVEAVEREQQMSALRADIQHGRESGVAEGYSMTTFRADGVAGFRLSVDAELDLEDIGRFTVERWSEVQAAEYLARP